MEYLFSVYWKKYNVGDVLRSYKKYYYVYNDRGVREASKQGFDCLPCFPDLNKIYVSDKLFDFFASRIVSNLRLAKMNQQPIKDPVDFLIQTEGKLITDSYHFVKEKKL